MGELEGFIGYNIKRDLANITVNISQPDLIKKMNQVFNEDEN